MNWYRKWRLRRAQEQHAKWKARYEELQRSAITLGANVMTRHDRIHAAGKLAMLEERVETLMREP